MESTIADRIIMALVSSEDYVNHDTLMRQAGFGLDEERLVLGVIAELVHEKAIEERKGKKGKQYRIAEENP